MVDNSKTSGQLIIELVKLRNKVYEFEEMNINKSKLNKRVDELEKKLEHTTDNYKKLNDTVKKLLLNNIEEINELLIEFEETNKKTVLKKAVEKIGKSITSIKEVIVD
ncbi:MAG: hypothetical protein HN778_15075 [Prolixibacteraceae bacterium]|jgi:methyl-accepting chemotaxis protein|nr:hypothetical protein [Prolixibacteraceae bacterium]MBT6765225.1 hypothetical protein [Prolixibacteraceae bacterium]MBT6998037.1 hypothetical protein [Prolixibacteraceae bacterium]MBT7396152.1 hypothetical protein [Prolixibacteraceae bacterium]